MHRLRTLPDRGRAILKFAVTATVAGVDIQTVGVILMIVGAIAFVIALVFEFSRRSGQRPPPPPPPGY